jgi:hypothetical protein
MIVVERFYDGADWFSSTSMQANAKRFWSSGNTTGLSFSNGRNTGTGSNAYNFTNNQPLLRFNRNGNLTTPTALVVGLAVANATGNTTARDILRVMSGTQAWVTFGFNANGYPVVKNSNAIVIATGSTPALGFGTTSFRYVEFGVEFNGLTSIVAVRVTNAVENTINFLTVDLSSPSGATLQAVELFNSSNDPTYYDDIYIHTGTSTLSSSDFLGDVIILKHAPFSSSVSGDGVISGWTDSGGGATAFGFELDDEDTTDTPTTDYVFAATANNYYCIRHEAVEALCTDIVAVQVCGLAGKSGAGAGVTGKAICMASNTGSTRYDTSFSSDFTLPDAWYWYRGVWTQDPSTGSQWLKANIDASPNGRYFGFERT